jgi:hypothetical protein
MNPVILGPVWYDCKTTVPILNKKGESYQVLIDVEGDRRYYAIGHYNFFLKQWFIVRDSPFITMNVHRAKWSWLPLVALEGKELKTITI